MNGIKATWLKPTNTRYGKEIVAVSVTIIATSDDCWVTVVLPDGKKTAAPLDQIHVRPEHLS